MNKGKRLLALFLSFAMLLALAACGDSGSGSGASASGDGGQGGSSGASGTVGDDGILPRWKCALMFNNSQTPLNLAVTSYLQYIADHMNGELQVVEYQGDDGQINRCQDLCNSGVDFIISENPTAASIKTMAEICEQNEVYLTYIHARLLPEEHAPVANNPYFLGYVWQDEHEAGRGMATALLEAGHRKFVYETCPVGTSIANDYRIEGVLEAIEDWKDKGAEVVGSVYAVGDWVAAAQNALSYEGADAFICSGGGLSCCIQPMREKGVLGTMGFATVDFDDYETTKQALSEGWATALYGGHFADACFAYVLSMNALTGHKLDDKPLYDYNMNYIRMDSAENYEKYMQYFENFERPCYDVNEIKEMLCVYNPDFTLDDYIQALQNYSLESVFAKRGV